MATMNIIDLTDDCTSRQVHHAQPPPPPQQPVLQSHEPIGVDVCVDVLDLTEGQSDDDGEEQKIHMAPPQELIDWNDIVEHRAAQVAFQAFRSSAMPDGTGDPLDKWTRPFERKEETTRRKKKKRKANEPHPSRNSSVSDPKNKKAKTHSGEESAARKSDGSEPRKLPPTQQHMHTREPERRVPMGGPDKAQRCRDGTSWNNGFALRRPPPPMQRMHARGYERQNPLRWSEMTPRGQESEWATRERPPMQHGNGCHAEKQDLKRKKTEKNRRKRQNYKRNKRARKAASKTSVQQQNPAVSEKAEGPSTTRQQSAIMQNGSQSRESAPEEKSSHRKQKLARENIAKNEKCFEESVQQRPPVSKATKLPSVTKEQYAGMQGESQAQEWESVGKRGIRRKRQRSTETKATEEVTFKESVQVNPPFSKNSVHPSPLGEQSAAEMQLQSIEEQQQSAPESTTESSTESYAPFVHDSDQAAKSKHCKDAASRTSHSKAPTHGASLIGEDGSRSAAANHNDRAPSISPVSILQQSATEKAQSSESVSCLSNCQKHTATGDVEKASQATKEKVQVGYKTQSGTVEEDAVGLSQGESKCSDEMIAEEDVQETPGRGETIARTHTYSPIVINVDVEEKVSGMIEKDVQVRDCVPLDDARAHSDLSGQDAVGERPSETKCSNFVTADEESKREESDRGGERKRQSENKSNYETIREECSTRKDCTRNETSAAAHAASPEVEVINVDDETSLPVDVRKHRATSHESVAANSTRQRLPTIPINENGVSVDGKRKNRESSNPPRKKSAVPQATRKSWQSTVIMIDSSDDERPARKPKASTKARTTRLHRQPSKLYASSSRYHVGFGQYNFQFSEEEARREQERLLKESAARVRREANIHAASNVNDLNQDHWKSPDMYVRLGLARGAPIQEVKRRFRQLALRYHPDKSKHLYTSARFQAVTEAYKRLCEESERLN